MKKILALLVSTFLINNAYCMGTDDRSMHLDEDVRSLPPTLLHFCEASRETQQSIVSSCFNRPDLTNEQAESLALLLDMTTYGQVHVSQCLGYLTFENIDDIDKLLTQSGFFRNTQQTVVKNKSSATVNDDIESGSFGCFCGLNLEDQREIINSNVNNSFFSQETRNHLREVSEMFAIGGGRITSDTYEDYLSAEQIKAIKEVLNLANGYVGNEDVELCRLENIESKKDTSFEDVDDVPSYIKGFCTLPWCKQSGMIASYQKLPNLSTQMKRSLYELLGILSKFRMSPNLYKNVLTAEQRETMDEMLKIQHGGFSACQDEIQMIAWTKSDKPFSSMCGIDQFLSVSMLQQRDVLASAINGLTDKEFPLQQSIKILEAIKGLWTILRTDKITAYLYQNSLTPEQQEAIDEVVKIHRERFRDGSSSSLKKDIKIFLGKSVKDQESVLQQVEQVIDEKEKQIQDQIRDMHESLTLLSNASFANSVCIDWKLLNDILTDRQMELSNDAITYVFNKELSRKRGPYIERLFNDRGVQCKPNYQNVTAFFKLSKEVQLNVLAGIQFMNAEEVSKYYEFIFELADLCNQGKAELFVDKFGVHRLADLEMLLAVTYPHPAYSSKAQNSNSINTDDSSDNSDKSSVTDEN